MRRLAIAVLVLGAAACGPGSGDDGMVVIDADTTPIDAECIGLSCFQVDCPGGGTTSVSGTIYAPNGTLPLYNVTVYVPAGPVGDLAPGAQCDRCGTTLSGGSLVSTTTDTEGNFLLTDVPTTERMPAGGTVPLVVQVGKWRRQLELPVVGECVDTAVAPTETRLPKNHTEGDIPLMALTTGGADSLECLLRKIGLEDSEFATAGDTTGARVHLYAGTGGTPAFDSSTAGGVPFANAQDLWGYDTETVADITAGLDDYDVVFLSCEAGHHLETKPAVALEAMKAYADLGGRVFASHWHHAWLRFGPAPWPDVVDTYVDLADLGSVTATVDTSFTRGADLADWLTNVGASTTTGQIDLVDAQHTLNFIDPAYDAEQWIHVPTNANGMPSLQYMSMTTPIEAEPQDRCGRAVVSDIHVSTGDDSTTALLFPSGGCVTPVTDLTAQEKVLAFMIFDIASCVGPPVE